MARRLDVVPGAPLLLLQRTYYDIEGRPIYYSDLFVRSDRYLQKIELFRHRQNVALSRFSDEEDEA
jgi:DNA-binding GntR family transcriptional regulator